MICIDQTDGSVSPAEPLRTLASYRRQQGQILFGQLLTHDRDSSQYPYVVHVGDPLTVLD